MKYEIKFTFEEADQYGVFGWFPFDGINRITVHRFRMPTEAEAIDEVGAAIRIFNEHIQPKEKLRRLLKIISITIVEEEESEHLHENKKHGIDDSEEDPDS